jgi:biopolymer transport protein ExbD
VKVKRQKKAPAIIPTASMADIAFLLIVFFMVTTTHEVDRTSVNLPKATIREKAEGGSPVVVMFKDLQTGDLLYKFSDGETMSQSIPGPDAIYLEASRLTFNEIPGQETQFMLKASGDIAFEKIDELLDQMRRGGVQKVLLLTDKTAEAKQ